MGILRNIFERLRNSAFRRLESPRLPHDHRVVNNMEKLYHAIRPGDVVLVEGGSGMSAIIKLFSHSHWSHVALYVGDALVGGKAPAQDKYEKVFGDEAKHLLVEAFVSEGVVAIPLSKYAEYNIRICRPFGILAADLQRVIQHVIANLGKHYDQQNIIDLALLLLPRWLNPFRRRSVKACLGRCSDFEVICSGMIAQAFQSVGYPILPAYETMPKWSCS